MVFGCARDDQVEEANMHKAHLGTVTGWASQYTIS